MTGLFGHSIDKMGHGHWPSVRSRSWQKDDRVSHDRPLRSGQVTVMLTAGQGIGHGHRPHSTNRAMPVLGQRQQFKVVAFPDPELLSLACYWAAASTRLEVSSA